MFKLSKFFVTLFYLGHFKFAPGTIASLISIILIFFIYIVFHKILFFVFFLFCFFSSFYLIDIYQKNTNKYDSSEIVIDEFLGIFIIFFFFEYCDKINIYYKLLLSFIFFRFFDILKPFPINWIENKLKNSFGVIFDDIIAGFYSVICLVILNVFI